MTVDDFLAKYNKCPFCRNYSFQKRCKDCKWKYANGRYAKNSDTDKFDPTDEWGSLMNREVTE